MDPVNAPGATFYLENSELKQAPNGSFVGTANLSATVQDTDLWERTISHLDGMVLHKFKDFKSELIDVLQEKNTELEEKVETELTVLQGELERARANAQHSEAGRVRAEQQLRLVVAKAEKLQARLDEWEPPGV